MSIEGIPDGWELVRIGTPEVGEWIISIKGEPEQALSEHRWFWPIIRKIEKPKQFRAFANAFEYMQKRRVGVAVGWKNSTVTPGFHAVVSANEPFLWVAFGTVIERFEWGQAFEKLEFRHVDGSTSPFGVEVTE